MIQVEFRPILELSADELASWRSLEDRAIEGNAFMSADFVVPALKHLVAGRPARILVARERDRWLAAVPVELRPASVRVPFPHLRTVWCEHSYLGGPLVDRDGGGAGLEALLRWLHTRRRLWGALELLQRPADGPVDEALRAAMDAVGLRWVEYMSWVRATAVPESTQGILERWSRNQRKKLKRSRTRLGEHGPLTFRTIWNGSGYEPSVDTFLELESMGWKGEQQSAMRSAVNREAFFREMLDNFGARRNSYVSQLAIGDRVIATSVNLVSGREGYGFKLGWDMQFAENSPGTTHEFEYILATREQYAPRLDRIDATSDPGSFVDAIWPDRRAIASGAIASGRTAAAALLAMRKARALRKRMAA
ncbi:MAG: GNAT family N-acetyltransferase [Myxococcales bacterium]|nr:GNAT family N-acetyltransferase [Myxococcales bacterium]MCB9530800.1 GNAT family N-acetyltransferase [Myxococcales bacterium]